MVQQQQGELNRALIEAADGGQVEECQRLIQAGANVNAANRYGITPLHGAVIYGHVDVCRLLLERGAVVNATNWFDWTPLHWAAQHGHVDVCRLLVNNGANVNATDNDGGGTPLHHAASEGHPDVCRLLIQAGANVNATDRDRWTPLHCAALNGHLEVCQLLIERGANVNAITRNNETPLDLAISNRAVGTLAYFYVHGVVNFHQPDHTGQKPWERLTDQQQGTLTEAMAAHQEKITILETGGLPNELARLIMGYL